MQDLRKSKAHDKKLLYRENRSCKRIIQYTLNKISKNPITLRMEVDRVSQVEFKKALGNYPTGVTVSYCF